MSAHEETCALCGFSADVKVAQEWPKSPGHPATAYLCDSCAGLVFDLSRFYGGSDIPRALMYIAAALLLLCLCVWILS